MSPYTRSKMSLGGDRAWVSRVSTVDEERDALAKGSKPFSRTNFSAFFVFHYRRLLAFWWHEEISKW